MSPSRNTASPACTVKCSPVASVSSRQGWLMPAKIGTFCAIFWMMAGSSLSAGVARCGKTSARTRSAMFWTMAGSMPMFLCPLWGTTSWRCKVHLTQRSLRWHIQAGHFAHDCTDRPASA